MPAAAAGPVKTPPCATRQGEPAEPYVFRRATIGQIAARTISGASTDGANNLIRKPQNSSKSAKTGHPGAKPSRRTKPRPTRSAAKKPGPRAVAPLRPRRALHVQAGDFPGKSPEFKVRPRSAGGNNLTPRRAAVEDRSELRIPDGKTTAANASPSPPTPPKNAGDRSSKTAETDARILKSPAATPRRPKRGGGTDVVVEHVSVSRCGPVDISGDFAKQNESHRAAPRAHKDEMPPAQIQGRDMVFWPEKR